MRGGSRASQRSEFELGGSLAEVESLEVLLSRSRAPTNVCQATGELWLMAPFGLQGVRDQPPSTSDVAG
jgi:hypothetical protein